MVSGNEQTTQYVLLGLQHVHTCDMLGSENAFVTEDAGGLTLCKCSALFILKNDMRLGSAG